MLGFSGGKTFGCPKHGTFEVAGEVFESSRHMGASEDEWETALRKATEITVSGSRPRILKYDFHDMPPERVS